MRIRWCAFGLCVVLVQVSLAAEPVKKSKKLEVPGKPAATPITLTGATVPATSSRKQLEELLQAPAKLDFGDRKQVTVRDILDRLHEQHHLSLRFDTPTL